MATSGGRPLYLAGSLPGELVQPLCPSPRGKGFSAEAEILEASPDRREPPCRHFGPCGGCSVQHLADSPYAAWKAGLLADAVRRLGFAGGLPALARTPPHTRRRMDLAIRRENGAIRVGLHMRRSASVVDMQECRVLHPRLFALVQGLRDVLRGLAGLRREGSAIVNLVEDGPDLLLRTDAPLTAQDRVRLAELAARLGMPRISWAMGPRGVIEPACLLRPAAAMLSGWRTPVPPGAFLQASAEGEAAIQAAVDRGVAQADPPRAHHGTIRRHRQHHSHAHPARPGPRL